MKKLSDYLDSAIEITGSDYKTAKALKMTRSAISRCRYEGTMKTANVVALAQLINEDPAKIVAACDIAKNPEHKAIWQKWGAVVVLIMGIVVLDINVGNQALASVSYSESNIHYAQSYMTRAAPVFKTRHAFHSILACPPCISQTDRIVCVYWLDSRLISANTPFERLADLRCIQGQPDNRR